MELRYTWLDVFAEAPLTGNQLCVFHVPADLDLNVMQRITRELNHSETTFLQPPTVPGADFRLRILIPTPTGVEEIPFAGHPIVGSACVAAGLGRSEGSGCVAAGAPHTAGAAPSTVRLQTGAGVIPVDVARQDERRWFARMAQPLPRHVWRWLPGEPRLSFGSVAAALGLAPDEIRPDLPIEAVDNGMRTVIIPLVSLAALGRVQPDLAQLRTLFGRDGTSVLTFAPGGREAGSHAHCRVFGPYELIVEDPATGSANGPFGEYLVRHGLVDGPVVRTEQGDYVGRTSRMTVEVQRHDGTTTAVYVGGHVRQVGSGSFWL